MRRPSLDLSALLAALAVAALVVVAGSTPAAACPSCNEAPLASGAEEVARGFAWSILFLLAIPFGAVAGFGGWVWYVSRRLPDGADERREAASGPA